MNTKVLKWNEIEEFKDPYITNCLICGEPRHYKRTKEPKWRTIIGLVYRGTNPDIFFTICPTCRKTKKINTAIIKLTEALRLNAKT